MIPFQQGHIATLQDITVTGKTVFLRADLNTPLQDGVVSNDARIKAVLPTLHYLLEQGAQVVLASHFGRPKGKVEPEFSLLPVADRLSELVDCDVIFTDDCIGDGVRKLLENPKNKLILLENLRFHEGEKNCDPDFVEALAKGMDVYVNDAFGTLHRDHASITGMPKQIETCAVGLLVEKELSYLQPLVKSAAKPYAVILGGAKISDKIKVVEQLVKKVDRLFIGGAMAFTFLKANGLPIGNSLYEPDMIDYAKKIMEEASSRRVSVFFPRDFQIAQSIDATEVQITETARIPDGWMGLDVGPKTIAHFATYLKDVKTVFWNGPMGMFEKEPFDQATIAIAKAIAPLDAVKIIGGGDSVAAVERSGVSDQMSHVSTGGGATLEFLKDPRLPGLKALLS
ncbi:MAG: phosphoglycerate kinase [Deltaproteobacteria bacterium]|nr:phosphoglycerate kinase [Deltaproteobacteria bacterium]